MKTAIMIVALSLMLSIMALGIAVAQTVNGEGQGELQNGQAVTANQTATNSESPTYTHHGLCDQDDYASPASY